MKYKFEDIIHNVTTKKKPEEEDKYNYIALEHIDSENLEISRWGSDVAPAGEKIVIQKGDVLFGKRRAYQKKVAISPIDGIFSAHGMAFRPKEDVICKEFLPFFISSDSFLNEAIRISVGGLSPTINWKDIKELTFDLPPLEEQKRLAVKLWAAYEVKQSYINMIAAIDDMVKAQFIEMFVYNQKVQKNELSVLCSCKSSSYTMGELEHLSGQYPIYGASGYIKSIDTYECNVDYVAIIKDGSGAGRAVHCPAKSSIINTMQYLIPTDICSVKYLEYLVNYLNLGLEKSGSTIPHIYYKNYSKKIVPSPSISEQNQFECFAEQADKSKLELRKSIDSIEKVIKSLINENL